MVGVDRYTQISVRYVPRLTSPFGRKKK
uniref:Uncharacterized protein n=1 Tax=Anguilla anguilla TaxID=7936 RepID=A0A0E9TE45_ANGAN